MTNYAVSLFTKQWEGRRAIWPKIKTIADYSDNESCLFTHRDTIMVCFSVWICVKYTFSMYTEMDQGIAEMQGEC